MQLNPSLLRQLLFGVFHLARYVARSLERESAALALSLIKKYNTAKQKERYTIGVFAFRLITRATKIGEETNR